MISLNNTREEKLRLLGFIQRGMKIKEFDYSASVQQTIQMLYDRSHIFLITLSKATAHQVKAILREIQKFKDEQRGKDKIPTID
jgi:hypothetical protein